MSSTGTTVAVGSPNFNGYQGRVQVYSFNGSVWTQLGQDLSGASSSSAGSSCALSSTGTTVAVGSPYFNGGKGRVQIYDYIGSSWVQRSQDLTGSTNSEAGTSCALSSTGTIVAVGSPNFNDGLTTKGRVQVYGLDSLSISSFGNSNFIGISSPNPATRLDVNGQMRVYESVGTAAGTNTGSLLLEHGNASGVSSLVLKASNSTSTNDYAYIQYEDNTGFTLPLLKYDLSASYTNIDLCANGIPSTGSNTVSIRKNTADMSINSVLVSNVGGTIPSQLSALNPFCLSFNQYNLSSGSTIPINFMQSNANFNPFSIGFTFSAWIRPSIVTAANCRFYLLNISPDSSTSKFDIYLDGDTSRIVAICDEDSTNYKITNVLTVNTWYHYAFTFDNATSTGNHYLNGYLVTGGVVGTGYSGKQLTAIDQAMLIGLKYGYNSGLQIGSTGKFGKGFHGYLNYINMFDRALTASDIAVLYNTPGYTQTSVDRGLLTLGIENEPGTVFNDRIALMPANGSGFVGINKKSPTCALDVSGNINASGALSVYGNTSYSDFSNPSAILKGGLIINTTNGGARLILGAYYTGNVGSACAIQASDFYSNVDNMGGQSLYLNPYSNVAVYVNRYLMLQSDSSASYIRGKEVLYLGYNGINNVTINSAGLYVNGAITTSGVVTINNSTASTTTNTGALIVSGGVGIGGAVRIGSNLYMNNEKLIYAYNTAGVAESFLYPRWSDNVTYLDYGSAGFNIRNNGGVTTTMFMTNDNKVGIGTSSPGSTLDVNGDVRIRSTATSSSTNSGALIVSGGVGIGGALSAGSVATNTITGATIQISPSTSINIADNLTTGGINIGRQDGTSTTTTVNIAAGNGQTGTISIGTGAGSKNLNIGGTSTAIALNGSTISAPLMSITNTTASTTTNSGALIVSGGVGIAGAVNIGNGLNVEPLSYFNLMPTATIIQNVSSIVPSGFLYCNGQEVNRTGTYARLFAAIGTTFGVGNNSTTFNVPNFKGAFLRGFDSQTVGSNSSPDVQVTHTGAAIGTVQRDQVLNPLRSSNQGWWGTPSGSTRQVIARAQNSGDDVDQCGVTARFDRIGTENRPFNYSVYYYIRF